MTGRRAKPRELAAQIETEDWQCESSFGLHAGVLDDPFR
jgi:hypothetical protein